MIVDLSAVEIVANLDVIACQPYDPVASCPACTRVDRHRHAPADDGFVRRNCTGCGFTWRQFTNRLYQKGI